MVQDSQPSGSDPRALIRPTPTGRPAGKREAPANTASPRPNPATAQNATKISVDPMRATDRYRLVMPWSDRV